MYKGTKTIELTHVSFPIVYHSLVMYYYLSCEKRDVIEAFYSNEWCHGLEFLIKLELKQVPSHDYASCYIL